MQVVYEQANEARDKVVGVNLDEEAVPVYSLSAVVSSIGAFDTNRQSAV